MHARPPVHPPACLQPAALAEHLCASEEDVAPVAALLASRARALLAPFAEARRRGDSSRGGGASGAPPPDEAPREPLQLGAAGAPLGAALDEGYATGLRGAAKRLVWAWLKTHWQAPAPAPSAAPGRVPGP